MKNKIKVLILLLILIFTGAPAFTQAAFPQGSAAGNTEMNGNISPVQIPNVAVQITQPQTGKEVAFSIRLARFPGLRMRQNARGASADEAGRAFKT